MHSHNLITLGRFLNMHAEVFVPFDKVAVLEERHTSVDPIFMQLYVHLNSILSVDRLTLYQLYLLFYFSNVALCDIM